MLTTGQSPLPREGRAIPDRVSTWWNENVAVVVRSRPGDLNSPPLITGNVLVMLLAGVENFYCMTLLFPLGSMGATFLLPMLDHWRIAKENLLTRALSTTAAWSYALYLAQIPIVLLLTRVLATLGPPSAARVLLSMGFYLVAVFTVAGAVYRLYEKPLMDLRDRFPIRLPARPKATGAAAR